MSEYQSWGNYPPARHRMVHRPSTLIGLRAALQDGKLVLPYGNGRSQGDSCLNDGGRLIDMRGFNHFLHWDKQTGGLTCEAGVMLADILHLAVPRGWFLPVTPGTKYITVGGAVANDVHGKNHHRVGSFGHHVRRLKLMRGTGEVMACAPRESAAMWRATIGGLGLTGVIVNVELQLRRIESALIEEKISVLPSLEDFFSAIAEADHEAEYTVAWIDCLARGRRLGRGVLLTGNHAVSDTGVLERPRLTPRATVPFLMPEWLLGRTAVRLFNTLWYRRGHRLAGQRLVHFNPFFYPLDGLEYWNRLYGQRGFFQYQCVVPREGATEGLRELLSRIAYSQQASFLSTVKYFGDRSPAGLLSFPRPGVTLAVDFANRGRRTLDLFNQLDHVVRQAGGALYPAKDSRMPPEMFRASFPRWREFREQVDPTLSSSFWRRVMG